MNSHGHLFENKIAGLQRTQQYSIPHAVRLHKTLHGPDGDRYLVLE